MRMVLLMEVERKVWFIGTWVILRIYVLLCLLFTCFALGIADAYVCWKSKIRSPPPDGSWDNVSWHSSRSGCYLNSYREGRQQVPSLYTSVERNQVQSLFSRSAAWTSFTSTLDGAREVLLDSAIFGSVVLIAWNEKSSSPTKPLTCLDGKLLAAQIHRG